MKKCPFCAEDIQEEAIVCRYCGRELDPSKIRMLTSEIDQPLDQYQTAKQDTEARREKPKVTTFLPPSEKEKLEVVDDRSKKGRRSKHHAVRVGVIVGVIVAVLTTLSRILNFYPECIETGQVTDSLISYYCLGLLRELEFAWILDFAIWGYLALIITHGFRREWKQFKTSLIPLGIIILILVILFIGGFILGGLGQVGETFSFQNQESMRKFESRNTVGTVGPDSNESNIIPISDLPEWAPPGSIEINKYEDFVGKTGWYCGSVCSVESGFDGQTGFIKFSDFCNPLITGGVTVHVPTSLVRTYANIEGSQACVYTAPGVETIEGIRAGTTMDVIRLRITSNDEILVR